MITSPPVCELDLSSHPSLVIQQQRELTEIFIGIETRNKYSIKAVSGEILAYAAETGKGLRSGLSRMLFGHWRTFTIAVFDPHKTQVLSLHHPFRMLMQRLEVVDMQQQTLAIIQQRFSITHKKFEIQNPRGAVLLTMQSPLWRPWAYPIVRRNKVVAKIEKKWTGVLNEMFTDRDQFQLHFLDLTLTPQEKLFLMASAIYIDLQYFEHKSN